MVGRLGVLKARHHATQSLGDKFNQKDFHYQVVHIFVCFALIFSLLSSLLKFPNLFVGGSGDNDDDDIK